jgi:hypothetical protein
MAHFAELDANNIVQRVLVVSNEDIIDANGVEQESIGVAICQAITGGGTWVQTSYNNNFRKQHANIGDKFLADANLFYNPVPPFPSWLLDDNYDWQAPTPYPTDDKWYEWDEDLLTWVEITTEETEP